MDKFKIPVDIEDEAKAYIQNVIEKLEETGIMDKVDNAALSMLARNYSTFIKASKQLEKDGLTVISDRGNLTAHPLIKVAKDAQIQAMKVMVEFGLTAKARTKLSKMEKPEEDSPFEQFIKEGKEIR